MAYFPMFIDIEKKKCLVAGGGTVALRKVRVLLDFGAQITVVAPQIDPQILQLTGNVCVKERTFEPEDLKECVLVVAATDDVTENHRIARMAQKKHIPVNAVDQQEDCSFIFPLCRYSFISFFICQWHKIISYLHAIHHKIGRAHV